MKWLESNPIKDQAYVTFLTAKTLSLKQMFLRRAQEQQILPPDLGGGAYVSDGGKIGGWLNWRGIVSYLWLIMCSTTRGKRKAAFGDEEIHHRQN
jgi:hypothetical protein